MRTNRRAYVVSTWWLSLFCDSAIRPSSSGAWSEPFLGRIILAVGRISTDSKNLWQACLRVLTW